MRILIGILSVSISVTFTLISSTAKVSQAGRPVYKDVPVILAIAKSSIVVRARLISNYNSASKSNWTHARGTVKAEEEKSLAALASSTCPGSGQVFRVVEVRKGDPKLVTQYLLIRPSTYAVLDSIKAGEMGPSFAAEKLEASKAEPIALGGEGVVLITSNTPGCLSFTVDGGSIADPTVKQNR